MEESTSEGAPLQSCPLDSLPNLRPLKVQELKEEEKQALSTEKQDLSNMILTATAGVSSIPFICWFNAYAYIN